MSFRVVMLTLNKFPVRFIEVLHGNALDAGAIENVTYNTLGDRFYAGWQLYEDSLQTTGSDITPFHATGGKVLSSQHNFR
ncbi:hypothetical protein SS1G_05829 [Sclerotinia sclerotiorum 1980 UF-70]|uniref:Uncharacterized protein n=1 Tax=Sclerotinia sclerotiorum (strain ATCC 18683 / 1980 / Ss-1) TaxID=665079 RepID=A7EKI2_SCLS1|nr:hypothetical protein SS1G_05829 [Sclerotinia sclerotiorum 1980 UF-70]EDO03348.1 hypothetical protein SS1G_05829 [Sclerotinia sclerotiorum 1980 UF-70]